jgi:hypothetical protein
VAVGRKNGPKIIQDPRFLDNALRLWLRLPNIGSLSTESVDNSVDDDDGARVPQREFP